MKDEQMMRAEKKKEFIAESHKQFGEIKQPSMDILECKRAESVDDSEDSSEISEVVMSYQDFLSRNLRNEEMEESKEEGLDDLEGVKHNVYVGKMEILPR